MANINSRRFGVVQCSEKSVAGFFSQANGGASNASDIHPGNIGDMDI